MLPSDLNVTVTRNYGETAKDKSDELLKHLFIATLSVTLLIALALGWRESGVVLLAMPVTLALTLAIFYLYRLHAEPRHAVRADLLHRHPGGRRHRGGREHRAPLPLAGESAAARSADVAVEAVDEVGNPTILATFAVIAAILPMAFVRGLMGPYMRPIPVGASAAMVFSLIVAFVVSPWAALRLLRHYAAEPTARITKPKAWTTRFYRRMMNPLIENARDRWMFLGSVVVLLLAAGRFRSAQMGASEDAAVRQQERVSGDRRHARRHAAGTDHARGAGAGQLSRPAAGSASTTRSTPALRGPYNFNGLVRHYFLRNQPNQADIQVNLLSRHERKAQSHEIAAQAAARIRQDRPHHSARASRWPKFRRARRCCRRWSPKCTARTTSGRSQWRRRSRKSFSRLLA